VVLRDARSLRQIVAAQVCRACCLPVVVSHCGRALRCLPAACRR
jgi:hypothetical protein